MQCASMWGVAIAFGCGLLAGTVVVSDVTQPQQAIAAQNEPVQVDTLASDVAVLKDKASDKPFLRPKIPETPGDSMINFDPSATWPL